MNNKEAPERVVAEFREGGMRGYEYLGKWNGYDVWAFSPADMFDVQYSGGPFFVLDDGEHAYPASPKDADVILRYFSSNP